MNAELIDKACDTYKKVHTSGIIKFAKLDEWLDKESGILKKKL